MFLSFLSLFLYTGILSSSFHLRVWRRFWNERIVFDIFEEIDYNILNKAADTIEYTYPFPAIYWLKNSTFYFVRAGVLFFMVDIFQNRNYKYSKSKQYHEFFICTHRKRLLPFKARNGGIHTLSAAWVNILLSMSICLFLSFLPCPVGIVKPAVINVSLIVFVYGHSIAFLSSGRVVAVLKWKDSIWQFCLNWL